MTSADDEACFLRAMHRPRNHRCDVWAHMIGRGHAADFRGDRPAAIEHPAGRLHVIPVDGVCDRMPIASAASSVPTTSARGRRCTISACAAIAKAKPAMSLSGRRAVNQ